MLALSDNIHWSVCFQWSVLCIVIGHSEVSYRGVMTGSKRSPTTWCTHGYTSFSDDFQLDVITV